MKLAALIAAELALSAVGGFCGVVGRRHLWLSLDEAPEVVWLCMLVVVLLVSAVILMWRRRSGNRTNSVGAFAIALLALATGLSALVALLLLRTAQPIHSASIFAGIACLVGNLTCIAVAVLIGLAYLHRLRRTEA